MNDIKNELELLYKNKKDIEKKIYLLEKQIELNSDFSFSLSSNITINISNLSKQIIEELKYIATFDNPQIQILQSLRKPIFNMPKKIYSFEINKNILTLPRGLMRDVIYILNNYNISYKMIDERLVISEKFPSVVFTLRDEQKIACDNISKKDFSICVAPPGFGKTLLGAEIISRRDVNTLVIVNKNMLLDQWCQRFIDYFAMDKKDIGYLGKGKNKLNNRLDIATMQSLKNNIDIIKNYSFVIVDECHHIPALTFENIIKQFRGKYILGLSATPKRKDAMDPILFQQLGNIAYEVKRKKTTTNKLKVVNTQFTSEVDNFANLIGEIINDNERNKLILDEILRYKDRKILLLTDRIEHIENLAKLLDNTGLNYISIHGSLKNQEKEENLKKVISSNLVLATTSYFGEGIDFPHLDTIIFATPISYYGRLVQYLGRIGRGGADCLAIDIYDDKNNFTKSAFRKRQDGYKQLHYKKIR
ncbi:MAG TPA: DEAD/DEAH box helicase [Arcobacter sp.]|nr:DEAD/DEAH box helicase [Arcobacter sp.]HIP55604.1 DEAD/DEAH box helicase [Arcobacter sp.]